MLNFTLVLGFIASLVTIINWIFDIVKDRKYIHGFYLLIISTLSVSTYAYKAELDIVNNAEKNAMHILENRNRDYTTEGFIQASLTFLEKHKELYPDSYARALKICDQNHCLESSYSDKFKNSLHHGYSQIDVASSFDGILQGIVDMNKKEKE